MSSEAEWKQLTLKAAGVALIDCDHRTPAAANEGIPYIAIPQLRDGHIVLDGVRRISEADYIEWTKKLSPQADDVIVVRRCNSGESAHVPANLKCAIGQNLVVLRSDGSKVLPQYLRWLVRGAEWWSEVGKYINVGAVFDSLRCRDIPNFELPVPPLDQQREIATILASIDDRITLLRETNATLEAIAQALFKSWFVDFDPVRAKMEGRTPEGMDEATAALFPDGFETSELGEVPRGWRESTLGELIELTKGCSYKGDGLSEAEGAYMFNLGCFNAHRVFASEKIKRYTGEYKPRHSVQAGDLIIANTDMTQARDILGRPAFVPIGFDPGFISHHVYKVTVRPEWQKKARAIRSLLFFALQESAFRERAIGFATGTTVLALPATAVLGSPALISTADLLDVFDGAVQPIFEAISTNEQRVTTLAETRDTLLPHLISGQLRLPEAQAATEAALGGPLQA